MLQMWAQAGTPPPHLASITINSSVDVVDGVRVELDVEVVVVLTSSPCSIQLGR